MNLFLALSLFLACQLYHFPPSYAAWLRLLGRVSRSIVWDSVAFGQWREITGLYCVVGQILSVLTKQTTYSLPTRDYLFHLREQPLQ